MRQRKIPRTYECEVSSLSDPQAKREWAVRLVADIIRDKSLIVRCKDCHGHVRLHDRHVPHGPTPHIEHLNLQDSENCIAGIHFRRAKKRDSLHRKSLNPVQ